MKLIPLLVLLFVPLTIHAQATIVVPPGGNLQAAINTAPCGSTIILTASKDGGVYVAPADFVGFTLPIKNCTAATPVTIRSSIATPADGVRVKPADRPNMPKLVARVGTPGFFDIVARGRDYRLSYLWFTNQKRADGAGTSYLLGSGFDTGGKAANFPSNILVDHCFFNPVDWDEDNNNLYSSVNYATELGGSNVTIRDSYMTGFGARYAHDRTTLLDGGCALIGTSPGPYKFDNNHCEAWFVGFFIGGGDPGSEFGGTVLSSPAPTLTSARLSTVNGLSVGMNIAFEMNVESPAPENRGNTIGNGTILTINGNDVTFTPLIGKWSASASAVRITNARPKTIDDPGGVAPCTPNWLGSPVWCSRGYWGGYNPSNISITRNFFGKPRRWYDSVGSDGKGFFEIKLCDGCLVDGNVFQGRTGFTVTVRNQGGRAPWSAIRNLTISNNLATEFSAGLYTLFYDNEMLSMESTNINFINNLMYGEFNNSSVSGFLPQIFRGNYGDRVRIEHNTILQSGRIMTWGDSPTTPPSPREITNFALVNNIIGFGNVSARQTGFACLDGAINVCAPGYQWLKNAMIGAPNGPLPDDQSLATFPGNFNPANIAAVGFTDPVNGNFRLLASSPYKNAGTDGKDLGVDMDQLLAHLSGPVPSPSPQPTSSPTPVATPTVAPSPSPSPVSSPLPSPTPVSSPQPSPAPTPTPVIPDGQVALSGQTFSAIDGKPFEWTMIVLSDASGNELRRQQAQGNSYRFDVLPGSYQLRVEQAGYGVSPGKVYLINVTANTGGLSIINFTLGPDSWFKDGPPMCVPSGGVCPPGQPTPSPSPVSSPSPLPSPSSSPTPAPTPEQPGCTLIAPAVVTLPQNSTGLITVTVNATSTQPLPIRVSAIANSGQVTVSPSSRDVIATSAILSFSVKTKKREASVTFSVPCGPPKTTNVLIR